MITELDILAKIAQTLKAKFNRPVYLDDEIEGFALPSFHLHCFTTTKVESLNRVKKNVGVYITYISDSKERAKEYYAVSNDIVSLFAHGISVEKEEDKRHFSLGNISQNTSGNEGPEVLEVDFTIEYYEYIKPTTKEDYPIMDSLHYELERKGIH